MFFNVINHSELLLLSLTCRMVPLPNSSLSAAEPQSEPSQTHKVVTTKSCRNAGLGRPCQPGREKLGHDLPHDNFS